MGHNVAVSVGIKVFDRKLLHLIKHICTHLVKEALCGNRHNALECKVCNKSYYVYDNKDNIVFMGSNNHEWVSLDMIDKDFLDAIINVEDQYFYYHKGFDLLRIVKSLFSNIKEILPVLFSIIAIL